MCSILFLCSSSFLFLTFVSTPEICIRNKNHLHGTETKDSISCDSKLKIETKKGKESYFFTTKILLSRSKLRRNKIFSMQKIWFLIVLEREHFPSSCLLLPKLIIFFTSITKKTNYGIA